MVQEKEGQFKVGDISLYIKTWLPNDSTPTVAKLVFVHGFSDHLGRYYDFFPYLARSGIAVYGFDQRGWGRSVHKPAEKGLTGPTSQVISDIANFTQSVALPAEPRGAPLFVLGHSMGGGEVLALASTPAYEESVLSRVRGWLLEAPLIGLPEETAPSPVKVLVGRLVGMALPKRHLMNPVPPQYMSRDPAVVQDVKDDKLNHDTGTLEGLAGMLDRMGDLASGKLRLSTKVKSLWLGHGDKDLVVSFDASKKWFDKQTQVEDRTWKTYEGAYHQLHADLCREEFYADVREWILKRCDGQGKAEASTEPVTADNVTPGETPASRAESEVNKVESKL